VLRPVRIEGAVESLNFKDFWTDLPTRLYQVAITIGKLKTAYLQECVLQNQRLSRRGSTPDKRDFLAAVDQDPKGCPQGTEGTALPQA
jgi:hypothetical protein